MTRGLTIFVLAYVAVNMFAWLVPPQPLPALLRTALAFGIALILALYWGRKEML